LNYFLSLVFWLGVIKAELIAKTLVIAQHRQTMLVAVVPCYNEELRLSLDSYLKALDRYPQLYWCFINDGSTDQTQAILEQLRQKRPERITVLQLDKNSGKGEAVRQGVLYALDLTESKYIAYFDADLATPIEELYRLYLLIHQGPYKMIMGIRLFLRGHLIDRSPFRYWIGKGFSKLASLLLGVTFKDTQCGIKIFKKTENLKSHFQEPFVSKWIFDVEILKRLISDSHYSKDSFFEEPLVSWHEVGGSKIKWHSFITAFWDLKNIFFK